MIGQRAPKLVIAYHGCSRAAADAILGGSLWQPSEHGYDWLGSGIYFWEYAPFRALDWARARFGEEAAVIEARIRLGRCLNLLDIEHAEHLAAAFGILEQASAALGGLPQNLRDGRHFLDRAVVERYCTRATGFANRAVQTVRGCFPEGEPLFPGSRILRLTHVQISVRDARCISKAQRVV